MKQWDPFYPFMDCTLYYAKRKAHATVKMHQPENSIEGQRGLI
jgi:hypothetical protein